MASKSIINIDIDDSAFNRFLQAFASYQQKLEEQPESWKKLEDAMGKSGVKFADMSAETKDALAISAASAGILSAELTKATKAQGQFHASSVRSGTAMKKLSDTAGDVGKHIFDWSKHLLKLGGVIGGLAGIGGLFGMDVLAESAMKLERSSLGLGVSPGELRSFRINAEPFFANPDSILQSVFAAKSDLSKRFRVNQVLGPGASDLDPAEIAMKSALKLHDFWQNKNNRSQQLLDARGFSALGFTMSDAARLGNTPRSALEKAAEDSRRDTSAFGMSQKVAGQWTELEKSLKRAGTMIETTFINQLAPLAPQLGKFSEEIGKDLALLVESIFTEDNVDAMTSGIKELSESLKSGDFKRGVKEFGDAIAGMARGVIALAKWMGLVAGEDTNNGDHWRARDQISPTAQFYDRVKGLSDTGRMRAKGWENVSSYDSDRRMKWGNPKLETKEAQSMAFLQHLGMTKAQAAALVSQAVPESALNPLAISPSGKYHGLIQWDPERQKSFEKMYGHSIDNSNYQEQWRFAVWELKHKYPKVWADMQKHPNDAAYLSNVLTDNYVIPLDKRSRKKVAAPLALVLAQKYGTPIKSSTPETTHFGAVSHEIMLHQKMLQELRKQNQQKKEGITIYNNTSANVARSANALG